MAVCAIAAALRALPQVVAYPYPIGYDVVNYYMPVAANLDKHWADIAQQFPFYAILLHALALATDWSPQLVVTVLAILVFSAFAASVYIFGRRSLALKPAHSIFLVTFVIVQVAVLRTTWDLHRDMLALTGMMFALSFLNTKRISFATVAFSALAAISDRLVGVFLVATLLTWGVMRRDKAAMVPAMSSILVLVLISGSWVVAPVSSIVGSPGSTSKYTSPQYSPSNLSILFLIMDGLLIVPAAYGFYKLKGNPLRPGVLIALAASFSWLVFPDHLELAADRWIVLSGVWLSLLAGYGIIQYAARLRHLIGKILIPFSLGLFALIGVAYAVTPYEHPFLFLGAAKDYFKTFSPPTMQFSVLDVNDTGRLVAAIESTNLLTESNAIIVGEKQWKGFMELYLGGGRHYDFSDNPFRTACDLSGSSQPVYLFIYGKNYAYNAPSSWLVC